MRKSYLFLTLATLSIATLVLNGCKKENGIDNETVVTRPYGLYVADNQGALLNTNDGDTYKLIFPPDGVAPRAIVTAGANLLWVKSNVHLSEDNGLNFNPTYNAANIYSNWQQMILNVPSHNRLYLCSMQGLGIAYSEDNGQTWKDDVNWDPSISGASINSFAQLTSGTLFAHDLFNQKLYRRDNTNANWVEVTMNGLPAAPFYLSRYNNTLLLADYSGVNGVWYSNDQGQNWQQYTGLPANRPIYCINAPFDQTLLVGTDSAGVYRLQGSQFVSSNAGLDNYTTAHGIIGKDDIYKNGAVKRYVFMSTSKGLYRSEDLGQNWIRVKDGSYTAIY